MAHAVATLHKLPAAAHLRHVSDSRSPDKHETQESNSRADRNQDGMGVEMSSPDRNRHDPGSRDPSSNDPSSIDQTANS
jgi:hypothetical protein